MEFELDSHFLKDANGEDMEPEATEPEGETESSSDSSSSVDWGSTMGACAAVLLTTFVGILFVAPKCLAAVGDNIHTFVRLSCSFACGSILACACFLMWIESSHYIASHYDEEVDVTWRWGVSILAGFLFSIVNDAIVQYLSPEAAHDHGGGAKVDVEVVQDDTKIVQRKVNRSTCLAVLIGDGFHNVVDGIFIGAAFAGCDPSFGWTVTMSTVFHEFSQELADFFVLIGPGGLKASQALAINFVSQLGVMIGGIVFCASEPSNEAIGVMLAFGGGVYMYIGATECGSRMMHKHEGATPKLAFACVGMFIFGAIVIGLVLLDHEHCEAGGDDDGEEEGGAHDGHNH
jgi:UTP--glucose-1-phosphate uridylyltransferase